MPIERSPRGSALRRQVDHVVGSPLLFALGVLRSKRLVPTEIHKVGILTPSALGDTIIASGIARDIKQTLKDCQVIAFTSRAVTGVSELLEGYDEEVALPITQLLEAARVVRDHPTDVLIDIMTWPRITAIVAALAQTNYTIGFRTPHQHRHFSYDSAVLHDGVRHEIDNYRSLVNQLGITGKLYPKVRAGFYQAEETANVILHPWAGGFRSHLREWSMDRWAELSRKLVADGASITITGASADRRRAETLVSMIGLSSRRVKNLAGVGTLLDTARYISMSSVVVSVNTGIMHLAAAMDKPLVALHGPTNPIRWGPLSEQAVVIGPGRDKGGAFLNHGFEYPRTEVDCMARINVDDVQHLVQEKLFRTIPYPTS